MSADFERCRLAFAVLLFHRGGPWTEADRVMWRELTGQEEATTKVLCDIARKQMAENSDASLVRMDQARRRHDGDRLP